MATMQEVGTWPNVTCVVCLNKMAEMLATDTQYINKVGREY